MGSSSSKIAERTLFNLKWTAKVVSKTAKALDKKSLAQKGKIKKAIEDNDREAASTLALSAIRSRNKSNNCLRLVKRLDDTGAQLESLIKLQQLLRSVVSILKDIDKALMALAGSPPKTGDDLDQAAQVFPTGDLEQDKMTEYVRLCKALD